jgi:nucleoside recognition membrane protein YjiH
MSLIVTSGFFFAVYYTSAEKNILKRCYRLVGQTHHTRQLKEQHLQNNFVSISRLYRLFMHQ